MVHDVVLLPGDGIGPEVCGAARAAVEATGVSIHWTLVEAGGDVVQRHGTPLPDEALQAIRRVGVALKGPISTPIGEGFQSVNVQLRKRLDLYASVRPVKSIPGVATRFEDVDLVVIRENTEGLYSGIEHRVTVGVAESIKVISELASTRIARYAFTLARSQGRRKITVAHKANIMKLTDGLFLECARRVATSFTDIAYEELIVDNLCLQLVRDPTRFDVLLTENLYGDILSDLCAGLVGGLGVVPGANVGDGCAVFEAVHGSAPDIAGKGIANPTAVMRSAAMMLRHLGENDAATRLERGILRTLLAGKVRTGDLGGRATTAQFTDAVIAEVRNGAA